MRLTRSESAIGDGDFGLYESLIGRHFDVHLADDPLAFIAWVEVVGITDGIDGEAYLDLVEANPELENPSRFLIPVDADYELRYL